MKLRSFALCLVLAACGPTTPAATTSPGSTATISPGSTATAPMRASAAPVASAAPGDCKPSPGEAKAFVRSMAQALQSDDKAAWDRMQSARYWASGSTDEGLRSMRFDAWKAGLRPRMGELDAALCHLDALDTLLVCDTSKPLKINVVREGCELKLNDN